MFIMVSLKKPHLFKKYFPALNKSIARLTKSKLHGVLRGSLPLENFDNFFNKYSENVIKMKILLCICHGFKKGKSEFVTVQ